MPAARRRAASITPDGCSLPLDALVAFAVIAAALFDPLHAAVRVGSFVLVVLIEAGVHPRLAGRFRRVLWRHGGREHSGGRCGWSSCRLCGLGGVWCRPCLWLLPPFRFCRGG